MDAAPVLIAGNTLLPVRFIAENMGIGVNWNDVNRAVYLSDKSVIADKPAPAPNPGTVLPPTGQTDKPADKPSMDSPVTDANGKPVPVINTIDMTSSQLLIKADSGELKPNVFSLHGPERIVIDIPNATVDPSLYKDAAAKSGETASKNASVSNVRYSLYNNNPYTVRIVLDMKDAMDLKWESGLNTAALAAVFQKRRKVQGRSRSGPRRPGFRRQSRQRPHRERIQSVHGTESV